MITRGSGNYSSDKDKEIVRLKRQLRDIEIYDIDTYSVNYDLIEEQIFKDYVFDYEINHGYSREISLRKALKRYIEVFKIYN